MITDRDRRVISIIVPLLLVAGYWFLMLAPKRTESQTVGQQLTKAHCDDMFDVLDSFCKFVESYFYQTSFGERSPNLLLFGFIIGSAHSCKPLSIHATRDPTPVSSSSLRICRFAFCLLVPEVCVCQILVELRPERLVPLARIHPCPGHRKEPLLTLLTLTIGDLVDFAPYLRLGTARDPVLWYHSPVLKNEISPDQTPTDFFESGGFGSWRPVRCST